MNSKLKIVFPVLLLAGASLVGCAGSGPTTQAGDYAGKGAGIGAGVGLFLGALTGEPDVALSMAAVGAGAGAAHGAYEGWHQDMADARNQQVVNAIRESNQQAAHPRVHGQYDDQLNRFLGNWQVEGWAMDENQNRVGVKARARATVGMGNQVDVDFSQVAINNQQTAEWGTATLAHDGTSYNMLSRFNTKQEIDRLRGRFNQSNETFSFDADGVRILVRFKGPNAFTLETLSSSGGQEKLVELYQFRRS